MRLPTATAPVQAPWPLIFSNQDLINAFASAAGALGFSQWTFRYQQHFRFDPSTTWQGHQASPTVEGRQFDPGCLPGCAVRRS
jgi:hypothetical protein